MIKLFRKKLRENMTEPEIKLWEYLKTKPQGFKFRRQHPIASNILNSVKNAVELSKREDKTIPFEMGENLLLEISLNHLDGLLLYTDQITSEFIKLVNK